MRERDGNINHTLSQSTPEMLVHIKALYQSSPVSVCIRNSQREILYSNRAFRNLSNFLSPGGGSSNDQIGPFEIYLFISQLELDCFSMGGGCVLSNSFVYKGKKFQIRMECREFNDGSAVVIWFLNLAISRAFTGSIKKMSHSDTRRKVSKVISELSNKNLAAFSFYILGFPYSEISIFLGVNERAVRRRVEISKAAIKLEFSSVNSFKVECFLTGKISLFVNFIYRHLNVT